MLVSSLNFAQFAGRGINKFSRHCYLDMMDGRLEAVPGPGDSELGV